MSITENVIPLAFAMGDLGYSLDNPMLLVEVYFFFKGKVCMFLYVFMSLFFVIGEVLRVFVKKFIVVIFVFLCFLLSVVSCCV